MQLCSGTMVFNMSRASSSSSKEGTNEVENNNACTMEPVLAHVSQNPKNNMIPPRTSVLNTPITTTWPSYVLSSRYTPLSFVPLVLNQTNIRIVPSILWNNSLYKHMPLTANLLQFGMYPHSLEAHVGPMNIEMMGSLASTNPPSVTWQSNVGRDVHGLGWVRFRERKKI